MSKLQIRSSTKHALSGARVGILYNDKDGLVTYCVSVNTYVLAWIPYMHVSTLLKVFDWLFVFQILEWHNIKLDL